MIAINPATAFSVPLSGTFAQEVSITRNSVPPAPPGGTAPALSSAAATLPEALARLASVQGGLAPLLADAAAAVAHPDLPPAVREAAQVLLSLGLDGASLDGKAVEAALLKSGAFLESALAQGEAVQGDRKLALLALRNALQSALPEGARAPSLSQVLPPPHRAALPVGEPPSLPSIALLDGEAAGLKLLSETDAALARTTLLQLASLPDAGTAQGSNTTQRLVVEIPVATPQGYAVIQLQVEPDGQRREEPGELQAPAWRINLAVDIEPLGPVRASIAQIEGRTHVNLFAQREAAARVLREDLPALQTQLAQAALEPGDLHCRSGVPQSEPAKPGLFVDRAS